MGARHRVGVGVGVPCWGVVGDFKLDLMTHDAYVFGSHCWSCAQASALPLPRRGLCKAPPTQTMTTLILRNQAAHTEHHQERLLLLEPAAEFSPAHNLILCCLPQSMVQRPPTCSSVAPRPLYSPVTPSSATMQRSVELMPL
jgi:hypothetical protein